MSGSPHTAPTRRLRVSRARRSARLGGPHAAQVLDHPCLALLIGVLRHALDLRGERGHLGLLLLDRVADLLLARCMLFFHLPAAAFIPATGERRGFCTPFSQSGPAFLTRAIILSAHVPASTTAPSMKRPTRRPYNM